MHATGAGRSCSAYGYHAIARAGLLNGLVLLRRRFDACARANARRAASRLGPGLARQRGFCDFPDCGGCDLPDTGVCDLSSGCCDATPDCGCDWPWNHKQTVRPDADLDDPLNNEKALRARIRQAQARARDAVPDGTNDENA